MIERLEAEHLVYALYSSGDGKHLAWVGTLLPLKGKGMRRWLRFEGSGATVEIALAGALARYDRRKKEA